MQSQPQSGPGSQSGSQAQTPPSSPGWPPEWTRQPRRPRSFVFPLLFVIVGVVLLLNNFGYLPWSIWTALGQLWPVLLILFGLDLLIGRRNAWLGAAVTLIAFLAVLGTALWLTYSSPTVNTEAPGLNRQSANIPLGNATSGNVTLHLGAGNLQVGALPADGNNLVQAAASLPPGMRLSQNSAVNKGVADVTISTEGSGGIGWRPFGSFDRRSPGDTTLDVQLLPKVPLTVRADVGAGQSDFDLSNLSISTFSLNNGAGQTTVQLPTQAGQMTADIHGGAGQIILEVPPDVGAYIHSKNGLVSVHVPADRFQKVNDGYQTTDYSSATNRADVALSLGVGEVDVR
jgi:hypothetical protein